MKGMIGDITGFKLMSDKNMPIDRYLMYPDMIVVNESVAKQLSETKDDDELKLILLKLKPMGI